MTTVSQSGSVPPEEAIDDDVAARLGVLCSSVLEEERR